MVYPSSPRLMNRVIDAVVHLCEEKGSTARDVLDFLRQTSKTSSRNLTMQVRRALKHGVNAGLLRHRSGRYKALFTLNPAAVKQTENPSNDEKSADAKSALDTRQQKDVYDDTEEYKAKYRKQRRERQLNHSNSHQAKRRRRSRSRKRDQVGDARKIRYNEHEERQMALSGKPRADIASGSSNRQRRKATPRDRTCCHHLSDCSDDDEDRQQFEGSKVWRKSVMRQECKSDGTMVSNRRSASRNRSPQRQKSQQLQLGFEDEENVKIESGACGNSETDQDMDKDHAPNDSRNGSVL